MALSYTVTLADYDLLASYASDCGDSARIMPSLS